MNFENRVLHTVDIFGAELWITETLVNTWIVSAFLILVALVIRLVITRFKEIPTGKQNIVEAIIETFDNFVKNTMGEENRAFGNVFFGLFIFILAANLSGLFNLRPPTADLTATLALSLPALVLIQYTAFKRNAKDHVKSLFQPLFIFLPINIIGELSVGFSLGIRLFGNILSGLIVMGLIYYFLPPLLAFGPPAILHAYFDFFAGAMQAFVFTILCMMFIKNKF